MADIYLYAGQANPNDVQLSNPDALTITEKTVEFHVSSIFSKLGLEGSAGEHRRVLAVLAFLRTVPGDPV